MHQLTAYLGQYIYLYTDKGVKLLGKPLHEDPANSEAILFDIVEPSGKYEQGILPFLNEDIGYVVELPEEIQQGIQLTLDHLQHRSIEDAYKAFESSNRPQRISFGKIKREEP